MWSADSGLSSGECGVVIPVATVVKTEPETFTAWPRVDGLELYCFDVPGAV